MKTITTLSIILLILNGCSSRITPPVQLEDTQAITINQGIIQNHKTNVPLDIYLTTQEWRASLSVHKGRYYLPNNKMIKTFYYAQHAYKIKLTGERNLINRYKRYFKRNGVTALFCLNPVQRKDRYRVDMMFSHLKDDLTHTGCSAGKNIKQAISKVIEI